MILLAYPLLAQLCWALLYITYVLLLFLLFLVFARSRKINVQVSAPDMSVKSRCCFKFYVMKILVVCDIPYMKDWFLFMKFWSLIDDWFCK